MKKRNQIKGAAAILACMLVVEAGAYHIPAAYAQNAETEVAAETETEIETEAADTEEIIETESLPAETEAAESEIEVAETESEEPEIIVETEEVSESAEETAAETEMVSETEAETETETEEEVKLIKQVLHAKIYTDDKNTIEDKDSQTEITLEGCLPEKGQIKVHSVELGVPGEETYSAYHITIYDKDGNAYQPEKGNRIKVTIDDPALCQIAKEQEELHGWHQTEEDQKPDGMDFTVLSGGRIQFETDQF